MVTRIALTLVILAVSALSEEAIPQISKEQINNGKLTVGLEFPKRCSYGDMDIIRMELERDLEDRARVIATIEVIPGTKATFTRSALSILGDVTGEVTGYLQPTFSLELPKVTENTIAGFFICKDGDADGSCVNNQRLDFKDIVNIYEPKPGEVDHEGKWVNGPPPREKVSDKVYFSRPIILSAKGGASFPSVRIPEYAATIAKEVPSEIANATIVSNYTEVLGSMFVKVNEGKLVVPLPYYEPKGCED